MTSIWQTKEWQTMLKKSGQVEKTIEFEIPSPLTPLPQGEGNFVVPKKIFIEKRSIGLGQFGLFVLGFEGEITDELEKKLQNICKEEQSVFIQIETMNYNPHVNPPIPSPFPQGEKGESKSSTSSPFGRGLRGGKGKYYKKFITPYTACIDLEQTEEEILSAMKPKGRYNIRLAEKKGVQVFEAEKIDANIHIFYDLMKETTSRDNFSGNTFSYYKNFLEEIFASKLLFAQFEDKIIAAGIFTFLGDVGIYYYGASSSEKQFRKYMAPYALQWKAIKLAKEKNCKLYDFLGVAGPDEEYSSLAGVTDFKKKFTSDIRKVSESFLFVHKQCVYFLMEFLRKMKPSP